MVGHQIWSELNINQSYIKFLQSLYQPSVAGADVVVLGVVVVVVVVVVDGAEVEPIWWLHGTGAEWQEEQEESTS